MKKLSFLFILSILLFSCKPEYTGNPDRFKEGIFSIPAGEGYSETIIKRMDSLHIESYTKYISVTTDSGVFNKEILRTDTL